MKHRKRRITALILAAAMSVSLLPNLSVAFAAPSESASEAAPRAGEPQVGVPFTLSNGQSDAKRTDKESEEDISQFFTVTLNEDNTCSITEFNRNSKVTGLKLPSYVMIDGTKYAVTSIGASALAGCNLNSIEFQQYSENDSAVDKITSIGSNAFSSNGISKIKLPSTVTEIGAGAFNGNSSLATVNWDELTALTSIGSNAFANCGSLEEIDISSCSGLTEIGYQAFYNDSKLRYVKLPASVKSIGSQTFSSVANSCFVDCSAVTLGTLTGAPWGGIDTVIYWGKEQGYNNNSPYIFDPNTGLIYGLKIGSAKYEEEKYQIDSETAESNINYWYYATGKFNGKQSNGNYEGFTVYNDDGGEENDTGDNKPVIPKGAPAAVNLVKIVLPKKIKVGTWTDENTFDDENSKEYTVKGIADGAFGSRPGNIALTSIDFKNLAESGMDKIPDSAFWSSSSNLTEVLNIPDSVITIERYAFRKTKLGNGIKGYTLELPSHLQTIGYWAFRECTALKTVNVNTHEELDPVSDLTTVDSGAFSKCTALTEINMPGVNKDIEDTIYVYGCKDDTVNIDETKVASAPFGAYYATITYKNDEKFTPYTVQAVDADGVELPWKFNRITGDVVGYDNINKDGYKKDDETQKKVLEGETITIPSELRYKSEDGKVSDPITITGVAQYDENTPLFKAYNSGMVDVGNVTIPSTVTRINNSAFYRTHIVSGSVEIPDTVKNIEYRAFCDCGLTSLKLPESLETVGQYAFGNYETNSDNEKQLTRNDIQGMVTIPRRVTSIPNNAFSGRSNVEGNIKIEKIIIEQYRYQDTDEGFPNRQGTFKKAEPAIYNNAPFGAQKDGKPSPIEYKDKYVPVLSDYKEDSDPRNPSGKIDGKPDQKEPVSDGTINAPGGTAKINLGLIMGDNAFTIIGVSIPDENKANPYMKDAKLDVKQEQNGSGAYNGSISYNVDITGITGNGTFFIEYDYGDAEGHKQGTATAEISIDCFHTVHYHDYGKTAGKAPVEDGGNGDDHYFVEGFSIPVKEDETLKRDGAVFAGWYAVDENDSEYKEYSAPEKVAIPLSKTELDELKNTGKYLADYDQFPHEMKLASLETANVTMKAADIHLYPVWATLSSTGGTVVGDTKSLKFDYNGGKDTEGNNDKTNNNVPNVSDYPLTSDNTELPKPTKTNSALVGWSTTQQPVSVKSAEEAKGKCEDTVNVTGSDPVTVYAVWAEDTFDAANNTTGTGDGVADYLQVKYDGNGGELNDAKDTGSYEKDAKVYVQPSIYGQTLPTRKGFKFLGYTLNGEKKSGDELYQPGEQFNKKDQLDILVAQWEPEGYAVVYHGNGNTGGTVPDEFTGITVDSATGNPVANAKFKAAENTGSLTRDYAVFLGWTTDKNQGLVTKSTEVPTSDEFIAAGQENVDFAPVSDTRVMDLYAVWAVDMLGGTPGGDKPGDDKPDYKQVFYDVNVGGQEIEKVKNIPTDDKQYENDTSVAIIQKEGKDPEREGYEFMGWSLNKVMVEPTEYDGLYKYGTSGKNSFRKSNKADILYAIWKPEVKNNFMVIYRPNDATSGNVPIDINMYVQEDRKNITVQANKNGMVHGTSTKALKRDGAIFLGWSLHLTELVKSTEAETAAEIISGTDTGEGTLTYDKYNGSIYGNVLNIFAVWAEDVNNNGTKDYVETTWYVKYNLNGGTYSGDFTELDKGTDGKGYLAKTEATLKYSTEEDKKKLTHDDSDSHKVVFVGWTKELDHAIIDKEGTNVPELIEDKITMPEAAPTANTDEARSHNVYAVWAVDENGNGEADYLESKVKLTYNYNDKAEGKPDTERVAYYDKGKRDLHPNPNYHPEPRKAGEVFIGWTQNEKVETVINTKPTDGNIYYDGKTAKLLTVDSEFTIDATNVTLYAVYAVDGKGDPANRDGGGNGNPDYNDHKVMFDDGDSSTELSPMPSDILFAAPGEVITIEDKTPVREGYIFAGWKLTAMNPSDDVENSGGLVVNTTQLNPGQTFIMPGADVTFTAQWTEKTGKVVYNKNLTALGGAVDDDVTAVPTDNTKYASGETVTIQNGTLTYTKGTGDGVNGAVFLGWSHEQRSTLQTTQPAPNSILAENDLVGASGNIETLHTTPFAANTDGDVMTLYAVWALDDNNNETPDYLDGLCTIVYDGGVEGDPSGVTNLPPSVSVNPEVDYTISNIEPSRTGYRFTGWKIKDDDTNYRYNDGERVVLAYKLNKGETVTLVAQWAAAYGVVYRANYGTGTVPEHEASYAKDGEGEVTLDDPTGLSRDGYTFLGWTAHYAADPVTTKEAETALLEGTGPNSIRMYKVGDSETKPTFTLSPDNDTYMIFYAVWAVDVNNNNKPDYDEDFKLTYHLNGGKMGSETADVTVGGYMAGYTENNLRRNVTHDAVADGDVIFIGWSASSSVKSPYYTLEDKDSVPAEITSVTFGTNSSGADQNVYAMWALDRDKNGVPDYQEGRVRLIYDLNGGTLGGSGDQVIIYYDSTTDGRDVTLNNSRVPEHEKMTVDGADKKVIFVGWTTTKPGTGDFVTPFDGEKANKEKVQALKKDKVELKNTDVTVYAMYAVDAWGNSSDGNYNLPNGVPDYNKYKVTYDLGTAGGNAVTGTAPTDIHTGGHEPGDLVDLANAPEYTGFSFVGWKDVGGDGSVYMPDSEHNSKYTMPERDVKFVAQWIANDRYMVRYHLNGGTGIVPENSDLYAKSTKLGEGNVYYLVNEDGSVSTTSNVTLAAASEMTRDNAVFLGWSVNEPKALVTTKDADTGYNKVGNVIAYKPEEGGVIMNLYAVWAIDENGDGTADYETNQHITVKFNANDSAPTGTKVQPNTMPADANVLKDVDYNIPGREPVRMGYTFLGWKIDGGDDTIYKYGGGNAFVPKDKMDADITFVAQWGADYGVAYHANGGTGDVPADASKYELGANVTVKFDPIPTRAGYIFLGWSKNKQYEPLTEAPSGGDMLLKDTAEMTTFAIEENSTVMNLYALWTADANNNNVPDYSEQWHIVYDHNGGTFDAGQDHNDYTVSAQTYNSSTDTEPVRAFLNGSVKPTHENQGDTAVVFVGWTLNKVENILASNVPSAEQPELITNVTMPQQSEYAGKDGKVTVYAVWALDVDGNKVADYLEGKVRLIYNANGGKFGTGADASEDDIIVYYDAAASRMITLNESRELSRGDNEVFVGWSTTEPTGDKDPITVGEENRKDEIDAYLKKEVSLTTEDVTVYAVYAVDEDEEDTPGYGKPDYDFYTVTYALNGGTSDPNPVDSNKYEPGEIVTIYGTEPSLANSAFEGWKSSDEADTTKYRANDSFAMPSQDITLTAQWTTKEGQVQYDLNGGYGTAPTDSSGYDAGDIVAVKAASDITRDKAVFLGWSHDKRSTLLTEAPAANSILNADGTTGANGGNVAAQTETTFAPDEVDGHIMTLYAVWAADTNGNGKADYTEELWRIVYDHNGGTYNNEEVTTSDEEYLSGTTAALRADILPIREPSTGENSYHFVGWTMDKRNVLVQNDPAPKDEDLITHVTIPAENAGDNTVTVYALWAIDTMGDGTPDYQDGKVKLIYNFDGGTFSGRQEIDRYLDASTEDRTVALNETFKPVRGDKEVFVGWTRTVPTERREAATEEPEDLLKNGLEIKSTDTIVTVYAVYAVDEWGNGDDDGSYDKPNGVPDYNKHTVTYDLGYYPAYQDVPIPGDAPTDAHNATGGHEPGDFVDLQMPPTVDGVTFEGWKDTGNDSDSSVYMPGGDGRKYTMPDRDVEFVAQWIKGDRYTVKYNANDATSGDAPTDDTEYILEETTRTPELTRYFYFIGSGENAGTRYYNVNVKDAGTLKKDNAVFVGWTLTPHDPLKLDPDSEESKITYYTEETTDLAYAPEEGGKVMNLYALWAEDLDGSGTADYLEGTYHVTYDDGVKIDDPDYNEENSPVTNMPEPGEVLPNEDYKIPPYTPTREGYTFEGWIDPNDPDGELLQPGDVIAREDIIGDLKLEAKWAPDNTVRYHANGGEGGAPVDTTKYVDGVDVTLASGDGLTRTGFVFIGWTLHDPHAALLEAPTITYYPAGAVIPYERDENDKVMNVFALWAVDANLNGNADYADHGVTFADGVNENDGDYRPEKSPVSGMPEITEKFKPGAAVTIPVGIPRRSRHTFEGWINSADPTGALLQPGETFTMPDAEVTLTAGWKESNSGNGGFGGGTGGGTTTQYTLKYNTNGGGKIDDEKYNRNTEVTLDKTPTREGYVFDGWYSDAELTKKVTSVKMTGNITVYAKWTEAAPSETSDPNGGNGDGNGSGTKPTQSPSTPDMLNGEDHFAYIVGYENGTVRPNNNITRAETVAIFYRLLKSDIRSGNITTTNKYADVASDKWYNQSVSTMTKVGIVAGRSETTFAPDASITRAEFAAICARFDNTANVQPSGFNDIDGHWAKSEIERAAALGWVSGYGGGTFKPDQFITRAEAMTMINRVLGRVPESADDLLDGMITWPDNTVNDWYYLSVQEATNGHYADKKDAMYEKWTKIDQSVTWDK